MLCLVIQLCPTLCDSLDHSLPGSSVHGYSPGKNTGVSCHALFQEIVPIQGSNPGLPHCRWVLYCLSHKGSPAYVHNGRKRTKLWYKWKHMSLKNTMVGDRNWTQDSIFCIIFFIISSRTDKISSMVMEVRIILLGVDCYLQKLTGMMKMFYVLIGMVVI